MVVFSVLVTMNCSIARSKVFSFFINMYTILAYVLHAYLLAFKRTSIT